jgi:anti-anti-sigma regulatory factor
VLTAAAAGNRRIIVDLAALEFIDCHALGALGRVGRRPGRPAVTCCSPRRAGRCGASST